MNNIKQSLVSYLLSKDITSVVELWNNCKEYFDSQLIKMEMGGSYSSDGNDVSIHLFIDGEHIRFKVTIDEVKYNVFSDIIKKVNETNPKSSDEHYLRFMQMATGTYHD